MAFSCSQQNRNTQNKKGCKTKKEMTKKKESRREKLNSFCHCKANLKVTKMRRCSRSLIIYKQRNNMIPQSNWLTKLTKRDQVNPNINESILHLQRCCDSKRYRPAAQVS